MEPDVLDDEALQAMFCRAPRVCGVTTKGVADAQTRSWLQPHIQAVVQTPFASRFFIRSSDLSPLIKSVPRQQIGAIAARVRRPTRSRMD